LREDQVLRLLMLSI